MAIPGYLTARPQWVLWAYVHEGDKKPTKVPFSAHTGRPCDVTNPSNWATYEQARYVVDNSRYENGLPMFNGVGYALSEDDRVSAFDLDNPRMQRDGSELPDSAPEVAPILADHKGIIAHMNTFTEITPSGKGFRVVYFGKMPRNYRTKNVAKYVEHYSFDRFLTFTGNHLEDTPETIEERSEQAEWVLNYLELNKARNTQAVGTAPGEIISYPQSLEDLEVTKYLGSDAELAALWNGTHELCSRDASSADITLVNKLANIFRNYDQVARLWTQSPMGQREKTQKRADYRALTMRKGFDRMLPQVFHDAIANSKPVLNEEPEAVDETPDPIPDGLLGFVMHYILGYAPRPIPAFALGGAIGLLAGIAGRAYNVEGLGLNQYVVNIGLSGIGKDQVPNGITRLMIAASSIHKSANLFIGPDYIQSASALIKQFKVQPSFVSVFGEFGMWLKTHAGPKARDNDVKLMADVLKFYGRSGAGNAVGAMIYSDKENNVSESKSPAFSIIGDTVPSNFYAACSLDNISSGMIPRFLLIDYQGDRPPLNEHHQFFQPDQAWVQWFADFCDRCHTINQGINEGKSPVNVTFDDEGREQFAAYLALTDLRYNQFKDNAKGGIWSRAYAKAIKLAALYAVGDNPYNPVIGTKHATWAIALANRDVMRLYERIKAGEVEGAQTGADGDNPKHVVVARAYQAHIARPHAQLKGRLQGETTADMHDGRKAMRLYRLKNLVMQRSVFRTMPEALKDREFETVLREMVDVIAVREAKDFADVDPFKLQEWGVQGTTKLVHCVDVKALERMVASDDS